MSTPGWPPPTPAETARYASYTERERARRDVEHTAMVKRDVEILAELRSILGQTITAVEYGRRGVGDYRAANDVRLTFTDGRTLELEGWGYDEWGISVYLSADPPDDREWKPVEP